MLNVCKAIEFAARTNQQLHWYYSLDIQSGSPITELQLKDHLLELHSGMTSQRLRKLPLAIGMPVMIVQNFDIPNGIINGCTGTLVSV